MVGVEDFQRLASFLKLFNVDVDGVAGGGSDVGDVQQLQVDAVRLKG